MQIEHPYGSAMQPLQYPERSKTCNYYVNDDSLSLISVDIPAKNCFKFIRDLYYNSFDSGPKSSAGKCLWKKTTCKLTYKVEIFRLLLVSVDM